MTTTVELTLRFNVVDPEVLMEAAREAVADYGMGAPMPTDYGVAIAEVLLHSNPGVLAYLDYGVEFLNQSIVVTERNSS